MFADHHDARLGEEAALTELPHLNHVNTGSYQAMIVEDDDWLQDFALSHNSPTASAAAAASASATASATAAASHEHTAEKETIRKPDDSSHSTSAQSEQGTTAGLMEADTAAAEPADLQVAYFLDLRTSLVLEKWPDSRLSTVHVQSDCKDLFLFAMSCKQERCSPESLYQINSLRADASLCDEEHG